jgi:hypothetical protein
MNGYRKCEEYIPWTNILLEKEWYAVICNQVDGIGRDDIKWNKSIQKATYFIFALKCVCSKSKYQCTIVVSVSREVVWGLRIEGG